MRTTKRSITVAAMVVTLAVVSTGWTQQTAPTTVITVPDMDCVHCAQEVGEAVAKVPGIAKIEYSVETRKLTVYPQPRVVLSPRKLWEAVERTDRLPSRLEGPSGTFTKKPKS